MIKIADTSYEVVKLDPERFLWGIGTEPKLSAPWAFKGGTSLKKCYIETWRFSEDLDFTVIPGGSYKPEDIEPLIKHVLDRVYDESSC